MSTIYVHVSTDNLSKFCRLCATKKHTLKGIINEEGQNKEYQNVIKEMLSIEIKEDDPLPKNICIECEDKLNSWKLFHAECTRNQLFLVQLYLLQDVVTSDAKDETGLDFSKNEIKEEYRFNNDIDGTLTEYNDDTIYEGTTCYSEHSESSDDLTIASLKKLVRTKSKTSKELNRSKTPIKAKEKCKINKFIEYSCHICLKDCKNWPRLKNHFEASHAESKTIAHCKCGFEIGSLSSLYKHLRCEHKAENKNVTINVKFNCHVCNERFRNWAKLKEHCKRSHKDKPIVYCNYCGAGLQSQSALYSHLSAHRDEGFLCDICSHVSQSGEALEKHKRSKHPSEENRKYQCATCDKIFEYKHQLISHLKSHIPLSERKKHKCDFCDRMFISRATALAHFRIVHENIKRFVCDLCGFNCATNGELKQHRPVHSDEKPFKCPKCGKGFKTKTNLKTHMDIHEDTAYECHICQRILNSRRTLRKHLVVHQSECSFVCGYCRKAFKRRETLKTHLSQHTGDKPYACKHCSERFTYASTLRAHRLRYHSDKYVQHNSTNDKAERTQIHCIGYASDDNAAQGRLFVF